ncbi:hypothetical protein [Thermaerobacillus caldiproteolyticus]|uniref:hypothetical protein n=1 Tax=Thermaerobacillus caldiproteolyticus TaxID=247480 RepID=UPI00188B2320|nr:hypothetical protein [Anoxybacillus caldiproteolyticus]QPA33128.1 hypothetical protein ISX45_05865 [Anoxybacillus caldiproteolyticus]
MPYMNGHIISGEFDEKLNIFYIQKIKNFFVESVLKENQLRKLYDYLKKHKHETDGQIITLYDQMLVRLSQDEIKALLHDLEQIQPMYRIMGKE